jgi:serine/threonine-protein kinase
LESIEFPIHKSDDLFVIIERLKEGLIDYSTGSSEFSNDEYRDLRKKVISVPELKELVPDFLIKYRNLNEFWGYIKNSFGTYADRRTYLGETFNPILDLLEREDVTFTSNYQVLDRIGAGGFGEVFRCKNKFLDVDFAIKFYSPIFYNGGEGHLERFFREARILFKLNHPNIIKVYDVGLMNRKPFIRMELFHGYNLNELLNKFGVITPEKALILIREISDALDFAHNEVGVVHRDLRPSNILVARPNQFRIIDFGLGIFLEEELVSRITRTGQNIAGGHWTAPELLIDPKILDPCTDIYSLGAIWFTLLAGNPPAGGDVREELQSLDLDESYSEMILKCLKKRENRYQNINELIRDIDNYQNK